MKNPIINHGVMLSDRIRMKAYRRAIFKAVKKGDVVCDIGTGSGILAFLCIQAGAKRVYAIERNSIIKEARKIAKKNKIDKKIVFINKSSLKTKLPEKVDVIVTETLGIFGIEENIQRTLIDAKKRFLKPRGKVVPSNLELFIAPAECPDFWHKNFGLWNKDFYGIDLSSLFKDASTRKISFNGKTSDIKIISKSKPIAKIDFNSLIKPQFKFEKDFAVEKQGKIHGLMGFFKARLHEGVNISTSPSKPHTHWRQSFFPLKKVFNVKKGDILRTTVISLPFEEKFYWQWEIQLKRKDRIINKISQSDFEFKSCDGFFRRNDYKPSLSIDGQISKFILNLFDGRKTVEAISKKVLNKFPSKFKNIKNAKTYVTTIMLGNFTTKK